MKREHKVGALVAVAVVGLVWWLSRGKPGSIEVEPEGTATVTTSATGAPTLQIVLPPSAPVTALSDAGVPEVKTAGLEVARFGWGSGPGNLGRSRPDEANPEAPMSLTTDAQGQVWILDQVNDRLVKLDRNGKLLGTVPVPLQAAQEVAISADGTALVMDRLVDKSVAVIGPDGKPKGELPILGKGLEEGGASTGLFTDGKDVYVEREHGDSVRIGSTSGEANKDRPEVPGRPASDGRTYLTASISDPAAGVVLVTAIDRETKQHRFTSQVSTGQSVVALNALDTDHSGIIYLGTVVEQPGSTPDAPKFGVTLICLDPLDGHPLGQARWPANATPEETFRELTVLPGGGVLFLERTETGSRVMRYGCGS